jgi:hypothetical protein
MTIRRVYFAFSFEQDLFRVNQIRSQIPAATFEQAGFFDPAEYERVSSGDKEATCRAIRERVAGTSVTLVLIGSDTAKRPFTHLGIEESIAHRNGLLGIYIHGMDDRDGGASLPGPAPVLPSSIEFPCYLWDWDLERLEREIELAGQRADRWRTTGLSEVGAGAR